MELQLLDIIIIFFNKKTRDSIVSHTWNMTFIHGLIRQCHNYPKLLSWMIALELERKLEV